MTADEKIDKEKVIKGLECCQSKSHCDECPYVYEGLCNIRTCTADLASDVLALLKEREPKQMRLCNGELCCPQCGAICKSYYHYCDECGQAVKWE